MNFNLIDRLASFVYPPAQDDESNEKRLKRAILVVMASATMMGGLVWGTVYLLLGVPNASILPYGYVVLSFINIMIYLRTRNYKILEIGQLLLILIIPTVLQWALGGFAASGAVMLWAFLSPMVALTVSEKRSDANIWLGAFLLLALISGVLETTLAARVVERMPDFGISAFYVMNIYAPLVTSYIIVVYFIGQSKAAQSEIMQQSRELSATNETLKHTAQNLEQRTEELRGAFGRLSAVMNSLVDGFVVTDKAGMITDYNPMVAQMFGLEGVSIQNTVCTDVFNDELSHAMLNAGQSTSGVFSTEISLHAERVGNAKSTPILIEDAELSNGIKSLGAVTLIRDITWEKEVDRMKTDFISTVSHELRTPLTSVLGFAKIIQKRFNAVILPIIGEQEDKKVQRAVKQVTNNMDIIVSEGERLTALINDVLDIAKMESGKMDWRMEVLSMADVAERAWNATSALFEENQQIHLQMDIAPDLPSVRGDADRLIQVLVNLISNAFKFTLEGSISCEIQQEKDTIQVKVKDTGVGIEPNDLGRVFDRFTQVGNTLTDKPKGTGLGLPICKQIVENHDGRIWLDSEVGMGTTVSFVLPIYQPTSAEDKKIQLDALMEQLREQVKTPLVTYAGESNKSILVVDDETNIRQLLREVLEAEGYHVREAQDGVEAIAEVKRERPDLVILDVMMPNVSGFDVAAVLKNNPDTMDIPIIILSIIEDKERGYRLGVDRYLNKPVDVDVLTREIETMLKQGAGTRKVLVMDEEKSVVHNISQVLLQRGFQVVEAFDNDELREKALESQPDMIVLTSVSDEQNKIVQTLRYEKGLENIYIVVYG